MKVICDRGALLDAVNQVSSVVNSRSPKPQLACVKLVALKDGSVGRLTLTATDGEISLRLALDRVEVAQPGEALVPADKLRAIVSAQESDPTLTIEADNDACSIRGNDAKFKILGYPPAEFPPVPTFAEVSKGAKTVFTHPAGSLSMLITRTLFAAARENSRYAINGVLLKRDGKRLEMVATDGRRLAISRANLVGAEKDAHAASCIVPAKALSSLLRLVGDGDESVRIALTDAQVVFNFGADGDEDGRACLSSNLVEGAFPPYEDVIPKEQDKFVEFDRDVMASAVRRAALLTNEESRGVRLSFHAADKQLQIQSRAAELGEAEITVDLASYKGDDIVVGFNPSFLTDALKVIDDPRVAMELNKSPSRPGIIKVGTEFLYVVMPVTLQ
ncbi:MAG: DNA polymerase III subunit beta [Phycisphaeraceae bacterium]|nr:DNA polymerase III subunit beta [Phycisphaeraceae bacterium]MCW5754909.1 DNA polymerase III subunit beta [Phycisphaeraceae bacterium]